MMDIFTSADNVIRAVLIISTVGAILSTVEDMYRIDVFSDGGVLSWQVLGITSKPTTPRLFWKLLDFLFETSTFAIILWLKLTASVSLLVVLLIHPNPSAVLATLTAYILFSLLLLNCRTVFGLDGAHHMNTIIFLASTLFFLSPVESISSMSCVIFIGSQTVLAYAISGVAKLLGPSWRNGKAIVGIMNTKFYGHKSLGKLFKNTPAMSKAACWGVMGFECSFVLALFVGKEALAILLVFGVLFHVSAAVFMGLNGFFLSFVATYPAIIYLNHCIEALWRSLLQQ